MLNPSGPYDPPAHAGEPVVRTVSLSAGNPAPAAWQPALRRWEIRLSESTLASWRDTARRQGAGLADTVRVAMELLAEQPAGTVRARLDAAETARAAGADAAMESFRSIASGTAAGMEGTR